MRRITLMAISTLAAVIMLFSYRTSTRGSTAETASAQPPGIVTAAATPKPTHRSTKSTKSTKSTRSAKPTRSTRSAKPAKPAKPARSAKPAAQLTTKPTTKPATPAKPTALTINGTTVRTPFGPVQVQVTISVNKIISVKALQHPSGNGNSDQINARALPQLAAEVLRAQSARVNSISGATYTSHGYTSSLQAALDTAHFA